MAASFLFAWDIVSGRSSHPHLSAAADGTAGQGSPTPRSRTPEPAISPTARLVGWHGPVEQLFVHPLVLRPELAFTDDTLGRGFQDYFITAREFSAILDQLWHNGWTLVDPHRVATGRVRVPVGRKPLVLCEDDVNYYGYFRGRGLASRLVLTPEGAVRAQYTDRTGTRLTSNDVVPLVEAAVTTHPELSADGARGILALTGYEGLFGEHNLDVPAARARVRALASRLTASGWTLASHTYGHITLGNDSLATIRRDTTRWQTLTRGLLGPIDILVYPYGSRPSRAGMRLLRDKGFGIQLDIDSRARLVVDDGVVIMSRRHVDGVAFGNPRSLFPFFAVATVRDPARPMRLT
jgi:hypothetical protein